MRHLARGITGTFGFAVLCCALAWADLPELPKDRPLPQGPDSPGVVVFSHASHVDGSRPDCTVCHPTRFPILKESTARPIRHANMESGRQCAACHNGQDATGLDDCATCHKVE